MCEIEEEIQKVIKKTLKVFSNMKEIEIDSLRDLTKEIYLEETCERSCDSEKFESVMNIIKTLLLNEGKILWVPNNLLKVEKTDLIYMDYDKKMEKKEDYSEQLQKVLKYINLYHFDDYMDEEIDFIDIKTVEYTIHYMDADFTAKYVFYGEDDDCPDYFEFNPFSGWGNSYTQGWCEQTDRDNEIRDIICTLSCDEDLFEFACMSSEEDTGKIFTDSIESLVDVTDLDEDFDRTYTVEVYGVTIEKRLE